MQPPSGGCVLKLDIDITSFGAGTQPPSGGCVLKHIVLYEMITNIGQPPSGGCVLKHFIPDSMERRKQAAAFGRLCVETLPLWVVSVLDAAAAFGRLCVETAISTSTSA